MSDTTCICGYDPEADPRVAGLPKCVCGRDLQWVSETYNTGERVHALAAILPNWNDFRCPDCGMVETIRREDEHSCLCGGKMKIIDAATHKSASYKSGTSPFVGTLADCAYLGVHDDQPCWGDVMFEDDCDDGALFLCRGHEGSWQDGHYIPEPAQ